MAREEEEERGYVVHATYLLQITTYVVVAADAHVQDR